MIDRDNEYKVADGKYEYHKTLLKGKESNYISIPWSIISDTELDMKRVGVFSYLRIRCGIDDFICFTMPSMVQWCGGKPDRRVNGSNDRYLNIVDNLSERGYLTYLTEKSRSSYMECEFNRDYYNDECSSNGYSVVYIDEFDKIMNYKKINPKDAFVTNSTILLVFAYLRYKIIRRPNKLKPEERYPEKIKERRKRLPEAYNGNINDMAEEVGLSSKTFSKIINILECDLKLIVTDTAYRIKNEDGEFRTLPTIFANTYKREKGYLLDTGKEYSRDEIELKAEYIREYYKDYKINKDKRKQ
jgi:hypothetical protein